MPKWRQRLFPLAVVGLLAVPALRAQTPQETVAFIGVNQDEDTRKADQKLTERLQQRAGIRFAREELDYEAVIDRLVKWNKDDGTFVARTTPYVYLVAEMLGADIEPLATYVNPDKATIYHSYLVVNRAGFGARPLVDEIIQALRSKRARFVYHNRFSTSSYLLPLLFFRMHDVFHMEQSREGLIAVASDKIDGGSSKLVTMVAEGQADIAAVWDNTKAKFENDQSVGSKVYFVQLPTPIPNDLLVCPKSIDPDSRRKMADAIDTMENREIGIGDFATWRNIAAADEARHALADLRWDARERQPAVTVDITVDGTAAAPVHSALMEAGKQAVRLAGTEFVLYDQDFHKRRDFTWKLEPMHDGAITLTSTITGYSEKGATQQFRLSFRDTDDLTNRLVGIIQSRLHRIRYVWGFSNKAPIVFRDIPMSVSAGATVKVQTFEWVNPDQNELTVGDFFDVKVAGTNRYRFELEPQDFLAKTRKPPELDPMSNSGYRVVLLRGEQERSLFKALTAVLAAAFILAGLVAIWDAIRYGRQPVRRPVVDGVV